MQLDIYPHEVGNDEQRVGRTKDPTKRRRVCVDGQLIRVRKVDKHAVRHFTAVDQELVHHANGIVTLLA